MEGAPQDIQGKGGMTPSLRLSDFSCPTTKSLPPLLAGHQNAGWQGPLYDGKVRREPGPRGVNVKKRLPPAEIRTAGTLGWGAFQPLLHHRADPRPIPRTCGGFHINQ